MIIPNWWVFKGSPQINVDKPWERITTKLPPWRRFDLPKKERDDWRGGVFYLNPSDPDDRHTIELINASLYLRRPLLVTGNTGIGKSSLAYAVQHELKLGPVLCWPITSHSVKKDGLYEYDAVQRLQEVTRRPSFETGGEPEPDDVSKKKEVEFDIGRYFTLKELGTALANPECEPPRMLLVDELDKSDMDLANDLLYILEEGEFLIPELIRSKQEKALVNQIGSEKPVEIINGRVVCKNFPFVILTSNGEREFPPPFLRRCISLELKPPNESKLLNIIKRQFRDFAIDEKNEAIVKIVNKFIEAREQKTVSTDQLLNMVYVYLVDNDIIEPPDSSGNSLLDSLLKPLDDGHFS